MNDYPKEFESIWRMGDTKTSRLSGRKEAGYKVFTRMKKDKENQQKIIDLQDEIIRKQELLVNLPPALRAEFIGLELAPLKAELKELRDD